jgi:hypothetical protein
VWPNSYNVFEEGEFGAKQPLQILQRFKMSEYGSDVDSPKFSQRLILGNTLLPNCSG